MKRCISVETGEQLHEVLREEMLPERLYLPLSFWMDERTEAALREIPAQTEIFAALPFVFREEQGSRAERDLRRLLSGDAGDGPAISGVLARSLEELAFLTEAGYDGIREADQQIPFWNSRALSETAALFNEWTLSPELNRHEIAELLGACGEMRENACLIIYGRTPMMVSAGCVRKTNGRCTGSGRETGFTEFLRDRKGKNIPVTGDCRFCYNVIRNAVPTSLHRFRKEIRALGIGRVRLDLTSEDAREARAALALFRPENGGGETDTLETTNGRFVHGVE
ncbi:MAG: hypothetical protein K6G16_09335 [Lachnospiraceae bacterium]|nr:hypothetical protein [Lachnospiraceae bacterium]